MKRCMRYLVVALACSLTNVSAAPVAQQKFLIPYLLARVFRFLYQDRQNPYRNCVATVRTGPALAVGECQYLERRSLVTKQAIENLLGYEVATEHLPRVALCCSGGGYRAMISTVGCLSGAAKAGLLDAMSYLAGLSGSTWCIFPWIVSGLPIDVYKQQLEQKVDDGLLTQESVADFDELVSLMVRKWSFGQPVNVTDLYGYLISELFLTDMCGDRSRITLGNFVKERVRFGAFPLPIGTALVGNNAQPYCWLECTPYEIGSQELGAYIPSWSFGRSFDNGVSQDAAPEQTLGYMLGTFGSLYAESTYTEGINTLVDDIAKLPLSYATKYVMNFVLNHLGGHSNEMGGGVVNNFLYNMPHSPFCLDRHLQCIDAGIQTDEATNVGANLPLVPLLKHERGVDIIVVLDVSAQELGAALREAAAYAQRLGYALPPLLYNDLNKPITIFKDETGVAPTIVYLPLVKNNAYSLTFDPRWCITDGYCSTFDTSYEPAEFYELSGLTEFAMMQAKDSIVDLMRDVVARKRQAVPGR